MPLKNIATMTFLLAASSKSVLRASAAGIVIWPSANCFATSAGAEAGGEASGTAFGAASGAACGGASGAACGGASGAGGSS